MFNETLRELRNAANLTQKQLAEKCNVTQSCIALLEKGRSEANVTTLIALSKVFGVSIDYLVGLEDEFGNKISSLNIKQTTIVTSEERELLFKFRKLNCNKKELIKLIIDIFIRDKT